MSFILTVLATLTVGVVYASVFEWFVHRYMLHRPLWKLRHPFDAHARTHHRLFRADESYHLKHIEHRQKVHMLGWSPLIIAIGFIPFAIGSFTLTCSGWESMAVLGSGMFVCIGYYVAYEYLHWCMHLPKERHLESSRLFIRLNGHHILHHRYMGTNFNVVCPLADLAFGTLLLRSKIPFPQVRGPSVPDVQPLSA